MQDYLSELFPHFTNFAFKHCKVDTSLLLLLVEHGTYLEDLVTETDLFMGFKLNWGAITLSQSSVKQVFSQVLSLPDFLIEFENFQLLLAVQVVKELKGDLNLDINIVILVNDPLQLSVVAKVLLQV